MNAPVYDYVIVGSGFGGSISAMRLAPGSLESFLGRIDELRNGAVVYVRTNLLAGFFATTFSLIRTRVVLVSGGSDWAAPGVHGHVQRLQEQRDPSHQRSYRLCKLHHYGNAHQPSAGPVFHHLHGGNLGRGQLRLHHV